MHPHQLQLMLPADANRRNMEFHLDRHGASENEVVEVTGGTRIYVWKSRFGTVLALGTNLKQPDVCLGDWVVPKANHEHPRDWPFSAGSPSQVVGFDLRDRYGMVVEVLTGTNNATRKFRLEDIVPAEAAWAIACAPKDPRLQQPAPRPTPEPA